MKRTILGTMRKALAAGSLFPSSSVKVGPTDASGQTWVEDSDGHHIKLFSSRGGAVKAVDSARKALFKEMNRP